MGLHQTKKFMHSKNNMNKIRKQPSECEKILANDVSDIRLISKIYLKLIQFNTATSKKPQSN